MMLSRYSFIHSIRTSGSALEEGPLPFLFNMRAAEAERRYKMALKGEDGKQYLIMIKPSFQEDQNTFRTALLYLDKELLLPTQIYLLAPDGKSIKDFKLSRIRESTGGSSVLCWGEIRQALEGRAQSRRSDGR